MSVTSLTAHLQGALKGEVRADEPMSRHTTYRIGGPADIFVTCDTLADLAEATRACDSEGVSWVIVGKGSNLLVSDEGYRGAILTLGREFKSHSADDARIKAGAACILAYVVRDAFSKGLSGLEFAVGIPGTVGGALAMNAGTREEWIGSAVESVTLFVPGEGLCRIRAGEVAWGYRESGLASRGVVVESVLSLREADKAHLQAEMERSLATRKKSQPLSRASAGSVFRNPPGDAAGRLIESVGFKGVRVGGASVSDVHANFIVSDGSAKASDVVGLMRKIQMVVRDTHGIELTPEIRLLGSFDVA